MRSYYFCFNYIYHFRVSLLSIQETSLGFPLALGNILIKINLIKEMLDGFILGQKRYFHFLFIHFLKLVIDISIKLYIFYLLSFYLICFPIIYIFIYGIQFVFYGLKIFNESFAIRIHYKVNKYFCIVWLNQFFIFFNSSTFIIDFSQL